MSVQYAGGPVGAREYLPDVIPSLWPTLTSLDRLYAERNYERIRTNPARYDWMLKRGHSEWRYAQLACTLGFYATARFTVIPTAAPSLLLIYLGGQFSPILIALGAGLAATAVAAVIERTRVGRRTNAYFASGIP